MPCLLYCAVQAIEATPDRNILAHRRPLVERPLIQALDAWAMLVRCPKPTWKHIPAKIGSEAAKGHSHDVSEHNAESMNR
jgi:hypothetical protein